MRGHARGSYILPTPDDTNAPHPVPSDSERRSGFVSVKYHEGEFPPKSVDWERIAPALAIASEALARYDSFLGIIPNPDILIAPMMIQEAVKSSKIEGTQATVGDVLEYNAGGVGFEPKMRDDIREVINYQDALYRAQDMMIDLPLCGRVLKGAHEVLLQGVRGQDKSPGMYRDDQNWIGFSGSPIHEARYVPVSPALIDDHMAKWEIFVNREDLVPLFKIAVAHVEFEALHPFKDGNGRVGRMLIPLMMWSEGLISEPCFFLSEFFDSYNKDYRDGLLSVSSVGDWTGWTCFFLKAVGDQAKANYSRARGMYDLNVGLKDDLAERSGSSLSGVVVDKLFAAPIFSKSEFTKIDGTSPATVRRLLGILEDMGTIRVLRPSQGRRSSIMVFPELMRILD